MTALAPPRLTEAQPDDTKRPDVPQADDRPRSDRRRALRAVQPDEVMALVGAGLAASSLAYLVYYVLLPWSGLLGFLVLTWVLFLGCYALLVSFTAPGIHVRDRLAGAVAHSLAFTMFSALVLVVAFTFKRGVSALRHLNFFTSDLSGSGPLDPLTQGGVLHAMLGTLIMMMLALLVTVPLGLVTAIYLSESRTRLARLVRTVVEAMTALPSIIAGLFILALIVTLQDALGVGQKSGLAASMAIAVMMLPIVIRAADVVLRLVPGTLKEAAAALGAPRWRVVWHVVMPTSRSGLTTAVILGTARGIGETSPVLLTAGYTTAFALNPFSGPMVSLPLTTFILTRSPEPNQIARGFGAAAVLMLLVLLLFIVARTLGGRGPGQLSRRQTRRTSALSAQDAARFAASDASDSQLLSAAPAAYPDGHT